MEKIIIFIFTLIGMLIGYDVIIKVLGEQDVKMIIIEMLIWFAFIVGITSLYVIIVKKTKEYMKISGWRDGLTRISAITGGIFVGWLLGMVSGKIIVNKYFNMSIEYLFMYFFSLLFLNLVKREKTIKTVSPENAITDSTVILDTSALIDERVINICRTREIGLKKIIIPKFVLLELQRLADSSDDGKRLRGRRGFKTVDTLKSLNTVDVNVSEEDVLTTNKVDEKIILLAKKTGAKIMTTDFNLTRVAELRGVRVVNLNRLAEFLKPSILPGTLINVDIIKYGKTKEQGVGFTKDGTMIVVEDGGDMVGHSQDVMITNILQTTAGKILFGRIAHDDHNNKMSS